MKCPCCGSSRVILCKTPEPNLFCKVCFHHCKNFIPSDKYYKGLSGRSKRLEKNFKKKNVERLQFLQRYLQDSIQILEFGCAEGSLGEVIKRNFKVAYYGIEPSGDAEIARKKLNNIWESVEKIPSDMRFNLILAFHALEHIYNIKHTVSQIYNLLAENGIVAIEIPNHFGNIQLPWDFNKEHIHLFSSASISSLLEKQGFNIRELTTGYYESAIYNDSMRIIAYKRKNPKEIKHNLTNRFQRYLGDRYIIYGVGGDFWGLVRPYIKTSNVSAIIDSSKDKIGQRVLGRSIQGPETIANYLKGKFLIATYRYQEEIIKLLNKAGIDKSRIVTLEDIFEK